MMRKLKIILSILNYNFFIKDVINLDKLNSEKILDYCNCLSKIKIKSFKNYKIINPYNNENIKIITKKFYTKYYNDNNKRRLILGSNPARRATISTGIPFEDANHLEKVIGIKIDNFHVLKASSDFLYDVINKYGGCDKFYNDFYMNFVFPFGIVKINEKNNETNCNYYEIKHFDSLLLDYIIDSIKEILKLNIDTSICYCIGSGKNYEILNKINNKYHFFNKIIPLEHPRFIMQYHSKDKEIYLKKYLDVLNMK